MNIETGEIINESHEDFDKLRARNALIDLNEVNQSSPYSLISQLNSKNKNVAKRARKKLKAKA